MACLCPYFFGYKLAEYHGKLVCRLLWEEAFGESSSLESYFLSLHVALIFIPFVVIAIIFF